MRQRHFPLVDKNGFFTISENSDCEYANPIEWFRDAIVAVTGQNTFNLLMLSLQSKEPPVIPAGWKPIDYLREVAEYDAKKTWNKELEQIKATRVPDSLLETLITKTKREQQKALKDLIVSGGELTAFYCRAFARFGFLFSNYTFEFLPNGIDEMQMPGLIYIEEDKSVTVIGNTPYSEKQLKQTIDHRRRRIVRMLDKENEWHCIFYDYRSMNGEETENQGPHVHYVSDRWGLTREQVLESLSRKQYTVPSLHIGFLREDD
ncbi:MAG: hypothetical protein ABI581_14205 [Sediminibacterium sp.]